MLQPNVEKNKDCVVIDWLRNTRQHLAMYEQVSSVERLEKGKLVIIDMLRCVQ